MSRQVHVPYTVEQDETGWFCAHAPLPGGGANGEGRTEEEAVADLGIEVTDDVGIVQLTETVSPATRLVDALIAVGADVVVHIEFQSAGEARFGWRMLEYRIRLAAHPQLQGRRIVQHVVVLGPCEVDTGLHEEGLSFSYRVHYVRELPVEPLLADARLAPFAPLAKIDHSQRAIVLQAALDRIAAVADAEVSNALAQAAVDLAALHLDALHLDAATIDAAWEDTAMPIPSLLQSRYDEGHEKGLEEGRDEGRDEGLEWAAASFLRRRFGDDDRIEAIARHLARLGPDAYLARIDAAATLDDLLVPADGT